MQLARQFISCAALALAPTVPGQQTLSISYGSAQDRLGEDVRAAGDVNADGYPDVIGGSRAAGYARVLSGKNGATLVTIPDLATVVPGNLFGGIHVAGGLDYNADGHSDLLVGGTPQIYSGSNGSLLATVSWAQNRITEDLCVLNDTDGDSYADFAVAYSNNGQDIEIYSGKDASLIRALGFGNINRGDKHVRSIGDIDGDGVFDLIAVEQTGGANRPGTFSVYSGGTGALLHSVQQNFVSCDGVGDVDGDGTPDYALGGVAVEVYSGATHALIHSLARPASVTVGGFGTEVSAAGDLNSDGCADIAVMASDVGGGELVIFSGKTGLVLMQMDVGANSTHHAAGDVNNDGFPDLVVGTISTSWSAPAQGSLRLVSGRILAWTTTLGQGCGGGPFLPVLAATRPVVGRSALVVGQQVPPSTAGLVFLSTPPALVLNLGVPGCDLFINPPTAVLLATVPATDWSFEMSIPEMSVLAGAELILQSIYLDTVGPLGFDLSNGLSWRLGY